MGAIRGHHGAPMMTEEDVREVTRAMRRVPEFDRAVVGDVVILRDDPDVNAYRGAEGLQEGQVSVTGRLLEVLRDRNDLAFILGHEAAHVDSPSWTRTLLAIVWGLTLKDEVRADLQGAEMARRAGYEADLLEVMEATLPPGPWKIERLETIRAILNANSRRVTMNRVVVIRVSEDDAEEIAEALHSKAFWVDKGFYDPEEEAGANARWVAHLNRLEEIVREATVAQENTVHEEAERA